MVLASLSTAIVLVLAICEAAPVSSPPNSAVPVALDFKVVKPSSYRRYALEPQKLPTSLGQKLAQKSRQYHSISVPNEGSYYLSALEIGSNRQQVGVILDTGSSDLWFPSKSSCDGPTKTSNDSDLSGLPPASSACPLGSFDESESLSYVPLGKNFSLYYGVKDYYTYAKGIWANETVFWGDLEVENMQFGLATDQDIGQGIIGISYKGTEGVKTEDEYANFPMQLVEQGLVRKNAYSLYLNSEEAASGTVLFGGIDRAKYDGELTFFDTVHINDGGVATEDAVAFFVNLDGASQGNKTVFRKTYPGLLDSGSTLLYAPQEIYDSVAPQYGEFNSTVGGYITPCSTQGQDFAFQFSNFTLNVPFEQLLYNVSDLSLLFVNGEGEEMCLFSMLSSSENLWILGDVLLRSAYIHYDLTDNKIGMAQAIYTNKTDVISV